MDAKRIALVGVATGLIMGIALFVVGVAAARLIYGPQFAPEGKFEPEQMNPAYFLWTKLAIGTFFGLLFTALYETLPLGKRGEGVSHTVKYAIYLWLVSYLWQLSHPLVYESVTFRNEGFWAVYTLGGFLGYGLALGYARRRVSCPI